VSESERGCSDWLEVLDRSLEFYSLSLIFESRFSFLVLVLILLVDVEEEHFPGVGERR